MNFQIDTLKNMWVLLQTFELLKDCMVADFQDYKGQPSLCFFVQTSPLSIFVGGQGYLPDGL